jgi:hypothetical protein
MVPVLPVLQIAKSEFLLGLPYGSLNMDSRLLLMPRT